MDNEIDDIRGFFSRRKLLKKVWQFFTAGSAVLIALLLGPFYVRYLEKKRRFIFSLNNISDKIRAESQVFLFKEHDQVTAMSRKCPHLGCTLEINNSQDGFICPCHGSKFQKNGAYILGPADKDMTKINYIITNKTVEIEL